MKKTLLVGYLILMSVTVHALVPLEGVLMGESVEEYQQDPLALMFRDIFDKSSDVENKKIRMYQDFVSKGTLLQESCSMFDPPKYGTTWQEKQAKRSMVGTLQYIGLDVSIKAIGAYAKKLELSESAYEKLSSNLTKNFCSKNVTVFSMKTIEKALSHYYKNPQMEFIPSVEKSPYTTALFKKKTQSLDARSNEFDQAIKNFKAFCSWGGDVTDLRMMTPYLKNSFIMGFLVKNMSGLKEEFKADQMKVVLSLNPDSVQVSCTDLICRKVSFDQFKQDLPRSIGSSGIYTDLSKLYCHHFRSIDASNAHAIPEVKKWLKDQELEDPILETSFFTSLMTGVPDPVFGVAKFNELPFVAKSSIDERWNHWSYQVLKSFSKDMLYEESLNIKAEARRDKTDLKYEGFKLDFDVTLGELDRVMNNTDKMNMSFDLKLSKNYIRQLRIKWSHMSSKFDQEGQTKFRDEVAQYLNIQVQTKEKYFRQKMWNDDFTRLIADELIGQAMAYRGPLFDSLQDEILTVPVKFSYGIFALSYLRYRSDVNAGRLKLNL